jgi:hypothetical protein
MAEKRSEQDMRTILSIGGAFALLSAVSVLHRFASTKKFNEISVTRLKREIFGVWLRVPNDSKSRIRYTGRKEAASRF